MRIIGISGLWSGHWDYKNPIWPNFAIAFGKEFPGSEFCVEEEPYCQLWQIQRLRDFIDRLALQYDDKKETILVGHSMGGVVACGVASKMHHSRVSIVSVFSPHDCSDRYFQRALDVPEHLDVPIISFHGCQDGWVPEGTKHPQSVKHTELNSDHLWSLVDHPEHAAEIAAVARKHFSP